LAIQGVGAEAHLVWQAQFLRQEIDAELVVELVAVPGVGLEVLQILAFGRFNLVPVGQQG